MNIRHRFSLFVLVVAVLAAACGDDSVASDDPDSIEDVISEDALDVETPTEDELDDAQTSLIDAFETLGLESLASAVAEIDVAELTDAAEFTFFSPNDEAFTALSSSDMADLLTDLDQLDDVLRGHIVAERLDAAALADVTSLTTEAGTILEVVVEEGVVTVGGATVVESDIEAGDGIIHVVDQLLIDG